MDYGLWTIGEKYFLSPSLPTHPFLSPPTLASFADLALALGFGVQQQVAAAGTIASEEIERRGEKKEREKESTRKDRASCFTTTAPSVTDEHDDHLRFQLNDSSWLKEPPHCTERVLRREVSTTPQYSLGSPTADPTNTGKLELPSISQVDPQGPAGVPWYTTQPGHRSLTVSDRLPDIHLSQTGPLNAPLATRPSRGASFDSSSNHSNSAPSLTSSYSSIDTGLGIKTPPSAGSPEASSVLFSKDQPQYFQEAAYSGSMNQSHPYMDNQHPHLTSGPSYAPHQQTSGMSHYQYPTQASTAYAPAQSSYGQYYGGVTSPHPVGHPVSVSMGTQLLPLPTMGATAHPQHSYGAPGGHAQGYSQGNFDTTGQVAPPGVKPRVTATLWEDEGSLCFQVEAKGVCVARREDNHFINGTKLLNVAGMTRGRRDGILKSEKTRHVVKIGPMHLKGVWIPFDRALEFANREKITDLLYPLFVHNIGALLYHPTNSSRTNAVMEAAANRTRRPDKGVQGGIQVGPGTQPAGLHHHHSMSGHMPSSQVGRPIHPERAHTFPTPPTSASSVIGSQSNSYDWNSQNMNGSVQAPQPLAIDTGLSNARSLPNTPVATPPGSSMPNMQPYQAQQPYDSKPVYSAAPQQQSQYATQQQNMARFGQPLSNPYVKSEMPPPSRTAGTSSEGDHPEIKQDPYSQHGTDQVGHGGADEETNHEHDNNDYSNDGNNAYNANRASYNYNTANVLGVLHGESTHLSPEQVSGSPHTNGSGRVTPRNASASQPQWNTGYSTPPRANQASSLYNVNDSRGAVANGHTGVDNYPTSGYSSNAVNGTSMSLKRSREDEDLDYKPRGASGTDIESLKRRRSGRENSIGAMSAYDQSSLTRPGNTIIPRLR
ncbi:MAG: hypothetical protein LQ340_004619 [Diploschistes diacapsis]|nr:MAG: hypothetical protein LQ340_004619 [Diploschistes diacapsis]